MLTQMTSFKSGYNVSKTELGKFVVTLGNDRSPFLSFDRYKDCLDKVVRLNSGHGLKVAPSVKKLTATNRKGRSVNSFGVRKY